MVLYYWFKELSIAIICLDLCNLYETAKPHLNMFLSLRAQNLKLNIDGKEFKLEKSWTWGQISKIHSERFKWFSESSWRTKFSIFNWFLKSKPRFIMSDIRNPRTPKNPSRSIESKILEICFLKYHN